MISSSAVPLRHAIAPLLLLSLVSLSACSKGTRSASATQSDSLPAPMSAVGGAAPAATAMATADEKGAPLATQRRVIRKADLSLESDSPDGVQAAVTSLATAKGGYVVGADTSRSRAEDGSETVMTSIEFRVPATAFDSTLISVRGMASHVANEKVTGEDVTEEYVDLEARLRARRALEEQYLTILKDAKTIPDTLAVEQKLGEVRTEIERDEGRRRFLQNQSDLSTFTVHISKHFEAPEPDGPGFGKSVKAAVRDAKDLSIGIVNGIIRAIGALLPFIVLIGLPLWFFGRWAWRRRQRNRARANP